VDIMSFTFNNIYKVRVVGDAFSPQFVAKDVCDVLGIQNSRQALSKLKDREISDVILNDASSNGVVQKRSFSVVSESGLYRLIFKSRKKEAEEFQDWVFTSVLPQIRATGGYIPLNEGDSAESVEDKAQKIVKATIDYSDEVENLKSRNILLYDIFQETQHRLSDMASSVMRADTEISVLRKELKEARKEIVYLKG